MHQSEKELTIETVERALQKEHKIENKNFLLNIAGDANPSGYIGANKEHEKAIKFYQMAEVLGSVECLHSCGIEYISAYFSED